MEGARRLRLLVVGSWTRVAITAAVILALWLVFAWLAVTGRLAGLQYLNLPPLHPYPPAGYVQNPFNPGDKGDLISVAEAARVKADLVQDGQLELQALEVGDPSLLSAADVGRAKEAGVALISQNNAAGLFEREQIKLEDIRVGRLADPNDSSIVWMVEERGMGTISYYAKSTGSLVKQQTLRFDAKYWLQKVGEHYLIADVLISAQPAVSPSQ